MLRCMHHPERVVSMIEAPGSALLVLADGVVPLDPESTVFRAMLEGWACQQRAWFLDERETIEPRLALVRRRRRRSSAISARGRGRSWCPRRGVTRSRSSCSART